MNAPQQAVMQDIAIKDIHLPEAISWWPLAMGWWLLIAFCITAIIIFIIWFKHQNNHAKKKAFSLRKQVMSELVAIQATHDDRVFLEQLSALLKRVAITQYGQNIAGLSGQQWLQFLDQQWDLHIFSEGIGQVMLDLPYQKDPDIDRHMLLRISKNWLENQMSKEDY
jgi:hypothetical protein